MRRLFVLSFVTILSLVASLAAQDLPPQPFPLKWKPVAGAGGYKVEVKDSSGTLVLSQQYASDKDSATLNLVPGPYTLKETTLNRLGAAESDTGWVPLHIPAAGPPAVGEVKALVLAPGATGTLTVAVTGLAQDATASLVPPSGKARTIPMSVPAKGTVDLTLANLSERGAYTVQLTNPPGLTTKVAGKVLVRYPKPEIATIEPTALVASKMAQSVSLSGKNLSGEAVVVLQGADGNQQVLTVADRTDNALTVIVPPGVGAGTYQVFVANAEDELPVKVGALQVGEAKIEALKPSLGTVDATPGTVTVRAETAGTLDLDGQNAAIPAGGVLPISGLNPGEHTLVFTYEDGSSDSQTVIVLAGESIDVSFAESADIEPTIWVTTGSQVHWSQHWKLPQTGQGVLLFSDFAKDLSGVASSAFGDISIEFSSNSAEVGPIYWLHLIGGFGYKKQLETSLNKNGKQIKWSGQGLRQAQDDYWVMLDKKSRSISVGFGSVPGKNVILEYQDQAFLDNVQYFGLGGDNNTFSNIQVMDLPKPKK